MTNYTWKEVLRPHPGPGKDEIFAYVYWIDFGLFTFRFLLAIVSVIFGITSWILIVKWRRFQNYLFISGIALSALMSVSMYIVNNMRCFDLVRYVDTLFKHDTVIIIALIACAVFRMAMTHWLLVATVMFYMDTVKVFYSRINRRYLFANTVIWIAPIVETTVLYTAAFFSELTVRDTEYVSIGVCCLLLLVNTLLYMKVLCTLIVLAMRDSKSREYVCEKVVFCLATCVTSGIASYLPLTLVVLCMPSALVRYIVCIVSILTVVAATVCFLSLRSHREAWRDYLRRQEQRRLI